MVDRRNCVLGKLKRFLALFIISVEQSQKMNFLISVWLRASCAIFPVPQPTSSQVKGDEV